MANIKNPLVSIIVPVYNVEQYIRRCIDSILNQSYKNIELIIVDDGSTDSSPQIIKEYIDKAIIVTQRNKGQAAARNTGLSHATGDFLCFVDSDDYLYQDAISVLMQRLNDSNADLICGLADTSNKKGKKFSVIKKFSIKTLSKKDDIIKTTLLINNIKSSVCAKLYRSSIILNNKCFFTEGKINEDNTFTCKLSTYLNAVSFVNIPIYYIEQRPSSTSRNFKDTNIAVCYDNYLELINFYKTKQLDYYIPYINCNYIVYVLYTLSGIAYFSKDYQSFYHLYTLLDSSYFKDDIYSCLKLKGKIYSIVYSISKHPKLFYYIIKCARLCGYKRCN